MRHGSHLTTGSPASANLKERRFLSPSCVTAKAFALTDITGASAPFFLIPFNIRHVKDLKQVRKISKDPADWDEPLIARSTGILPEDLDNMDLADYMELQKRFQQVTGLGKSDENADAGAGAAGEVV